MTNYKTQIQLETELTRACAELSVFISKGHTPAQRDFSKEWQALRNRNYLKNKGR